MTWTANNPDSGVTTGSGPARTGQYGFFTLPHGNYATGVDCHVPGNCTDGWVGTAVASLCGVGGWIEGTYAKIEFIIDGDRANPVGFGANAGVTHQPKFFGVIVPEGFTTFEIHETEGKAEDQKLLFADDFWFGFLPTGMWLSVRRRSRSIARTSRPISTIRRTCSARRPAASGSTHLRRVSSGSTGCSSPRAASAAVGGRSASARPTRLDRSGTAPATSC